MWESWVIYQCNICVNAVQLVLWNRNLGSRYFQFLFFFSMKDKYILFLDMSAYCYISCWTAFKNLAFPISLNSNHWVIMGGGRLLMGDCKYFQLLFSYGLCVYYSTLTTVQVYEAFLKWKAIIDTYQYFVHHLFHACCCCCMYKMSFEMSTCSLCSFVNQFTIFTSVGSFSYKIHIIYDFWYLCLKALIIYVVLQIISWENWIFKFSSS